MGIRNAGPFFNDKDIEDILNDIRNSLKSGMLTMGKNIEQFENQFAKYIGVKYAIALNSGTSALEVALRYFDVKNKEVIVPTNSFVASANAVIFAGGEPILCDTKDETLCIDPDDFRKKITPKTKGVIVVHLAGLIPPQMKELKDICNENNLFLIEDAAHAPGASLDNKKAGSLGDAGCFSFFPTKPLTTGEGGMITTNDSNLANFAKSLRHHGKEGDAHTRLGYNWRMSEIHAILGIYQLKRLDEHIAIRNQIAKKYAEGLENVDGISLISVPSNIVHSYWKYPIILTSGIEALDLQKTLKNKYDIDTGTLYYPPIHLQPFYKQRFNYKEGMLPSAEGILKKETCLPMFVGLSEKETDYVIDSLKKEIG